MRFRSQKDHGTPCSIAVDNPIVVLKCLDLFVHNLDFMYPIAWKTAIDGWGCSGVNTEFITYHWSTDATLIESIPVILYQRYILFPNIAWDTPVNLDVILKFFAMCSEVPSDDVITKCSGQGKYSLDCIFLTSMQIILALIFRVGWKWDILGGGFLSPDLGWDCNNEDIMVRK